MSENQQTCGGHFRYRHPEVLVLHHVQAEFMLVEQNLQLAAREMPVQRHIVTPTCGCAYTGRIRAAPCPDYVEMYVTALIAKFVHDGDRLVNSFFRSETAKAYVPGGPVSEKELFPLP